MRIVAIADAHVDATTSGSYVRRGSAILDHTTWQEAQQRLQDAVDVANDVGADIFTISGDVYNSGKPLPELVARTHQTLSRLKTAKVIATDGNHDQAGILGDHRTPLGAYMAEQPWCHAVQDTPGVVEYDGLYVASVPWPRVAGSRRLEDVERETLDAVHRMQDQLAGKQSILIGHLTVSEASFSSGRRSSETAMSVSTQEATVPTRTLGAGPWTYALLGHIHKRQQMDDTVMYLGSTYKVSYGEMDERKGCTVVDLHENGSSEWNFYPFAVRELALFDISSGETRLRASSVERYRKGDIIRVLVSDVDHVDGRSTKVIEDLRQRGCEVHLRQVSFEGVKASGPKVPVSSTTATTPDVAFREYSTRQGINPERIDALVRYFAEVTAASDAEA